MHKSKIVFFFALVGFAFSNTYSLAQSIENKNTEKLPELTPENVPAPTPQLTDNVDFTELRNTFAKRSDFQMRCELTRPTKEVGEAMQASNFKVAYDLASKWLDKCPVDARAHMWAFGALNRLGESDKAKEHKRWIIGLTDSVIKTGDGNSPQTAYVTISISEEYEVLRRFGLQRIKQSVVNGPPPVDLIVAEPVGGGTEQQSIYFNPYWHFVRLSHLLNEKKSR